MFKSLDHLPQRFRVGEKVGFGLTTDTIHPVLVVGTHSVLYPSDEIGVRLMQIGRAMVLQQERVNAPPPYNIALRFDKGYIV